MRTFSYPNTPSTTKPGDIFQDYLARSAPRAASFPSRSGLTQWHVSLMHLFKLGTLMFNPPMITTCSIATHRRDRAPAVFLQDPSRE